MPHTEDKDEQRKTIVLNRMVTRASDKEKRLRLESLTNPATSKVLSPIEILY